MANKKYVAEFEVNADGAITGIRKISDATDTTANSVNNLKGQIRELQKELANTDPQSQKYVDLSKKIGALKDQVNDAAEAIRANAGSALETFGGNASLVGERLSNLDFEGAASAVNGLAGATKNLKFGEVNKGAGELTKGLFNLGKALLTNPIFLIGSAILLIITNFDKLLQVFPPLNIAFNAIKEVLGFITSAISSFTDAIGLTSIAADNALENQIKNRDQAVSDLDRQEKRAKAQAKINGEDIVKIEQEYADKRKKIYQDIISGLEAKVKAGRSLTEQEIKDLQDAKNSVADIEVQALEKQAEAAEKAREDQRKAEEEAEREREKRKAESDRKAEERRKAAEQARQEIKDREKNLTDTLAQQEEARYQNSLEGVDKELRIMDLKYEKLLQQAGENKDLQAQVLAAQTQEQSDILKRAADEEIRIQKEAAEKAAEETKKIKQEAALEQVALEESISEELRQSKLSEEGKELDSLRERFFERKTLLEQSGADTAEVTELYELQKSEIEKKYSDERKEKQKLDDQEDLENIKARNAARLELATQALEVLGSLNENKTKEIGDKIKGIDKEIENAKTIQERNAAIARRKALETEAKKAFERNKALQIAQALIQTYQSATSAYASQLVVPTPDAPIRAAVAAGVAVGAGLAQVAKIRSTKYDSGSIPSSSNIPTPSVGGGGEGGSTGTPNFGGLDLSFLQNRPQQPTPSYVLAGEVSGAQEARGKIEDLARLTG
jgi:hypothetical protein